MTNEQLTKLAQRISDQGKDATVIDMLAVLGMVTCQVLMQLPAEERMAGTVGWVAMLTQTMKQNHIKTTAN